jgi:hypothetical protein
VRRPDSIVDVWTPSGEVSLDVGEGCEVGAKNFPGAGPEIPERAVLLTNVAGTASAVALSRALLIRHGEGESKLFPNAEVALSTRYARISVGRRVFWIRARALDRTNSTNSPTPWRTFEATVQDILHVRTYFGGRHSRAERLVALACVAPMIAEWDVVPEVRSEGPHYDAAESLGLAVKNFASQLSKLKASIFLESHLGIGHQRFVESLFLSRCFAPSDLGDLPVQPNNSLFLSPWTKGIRRP